MDGADVCRTSSRASRRPPYVISTVAILDQRWLRRKWCHPGPGAGFSTPIAEAEENGGPSASGRHLGWPHFRFPQMRSSKMATGSGRAAIFLRLRNRGRKTRPMLLLDMCYQNWHLFCHCWALQTNHFDPTPGIPKNTTQHQDVSFQSTLDRRPMYYSQNGPVESECKLNNVNSHIIRNQYQIQNQREVTLNEDRYYKSCHYQTNTELYYSIQISSESPMEYSRSPTKSIPKENQLKILNKIYQTYLVSTTAIND